MRLPVGWTQYFEENTAGSAGYLAGIGGASRRSEYHCATVDARPTRERESTQRISYTGGVALGPMRVNCVS